MRETIAIYGNYEITRHLATGMFEVWSAVAKVGLFLSEARARQWAEARHRASICEDHHHAHASHHRHRHWLRHHHRALHRRLLAAADRDAIEPIASRYG